MISAKQYKTTKEFQDDVALFAQALINKVADRREDTKIKVRQENPRSYLLTIEKGTKGEHAYSEEHYNLTLGNDGLVESTSVYF